MSADTDNPALPPFTGMSLDRASTERKDADWVRGRVADPESRVIAAGREGVVVAGDRTARAGARARARRPAPAADPAAGSTGPPRCSRSTSRGLAPEVGAARSTANRVMGLRAAGGRLMLPHSEAGLAAYADGAAQLAPPPPLLRQLRRRHGRRRGRLLAALPALRRRPLPPHRPGGDHDRRARRPAAARPPCRAGRAGGSRCSPGSSRRASRPRRPSSARSSEESGVVARDPVYVASQPWPFPASLMLGFHARVRWRRAASRATASSRRCTGCAATRSRRRSEAGTPGSSCRRRCRSRAF